MKVEKTSIEGLLIITPDVITDERGYFMEAFHTLKYNEIGIHETFVQDNESCSKKGVLRGLHFQRDPYAQGKLVRVMRGSAQDVAVDIRKGSPTFGKYVSVELSEANKKLFWIPAGFAHGFLALEDNTVFHYKCTELYRKDTEGCIRWNDPEIKIQWMLKDPVVSEKDQAGKNLNSEF